jgi:hypothetical protein
MKWRALTALLLTAMPTPAAAAAIYRNGNNIYLSGEIEAGDDKTFAHIAGDERLLVHLSSPGGNLHEAMRIGELIRSKAYATVVPANAECRSACAFIWVAGATRELGESAKLRMHCSYLPPATTCNEPAKPGLLAYLEKMGAPRELISLEEYAFAQGLDVQIIVRPDMEGLVVATRPEQVETVPMPRSRPASAARVAVATPRISRPFCPIVSTVTLGLFCF